MRGKLMEMWTAEEHKAILNEHPDNAVAAHRYSLSGCGKVSRQLVQYWRKVFITDGTLAKANKAIVSTRRLRKFSPTEDIGVLPCFRKPYHSILVIPDQHSPYHHPDAWNFLAAVKAAFEPDLVVNLGDETDGHALSFHDSDPNLDSAGVELDKAREGLSYLHALFPTMLICDSNHGSMVYRKAKHHGIPAQAIKSYREILFPEHKAPGWSWADEWIVHTPLGAVMFKHQASNVVAEAAHQRCNLMVGHNHSLFEVKYAASSDYLYWGATSGCLVDNDAMAFAYGKTFMKKPIVGCTVVLEGRPVLVPMVLNSKGRWIGRV